MNLSVLTDNLPFVAVAIGALLLAWSQRKKILGSITGILPTPKANKRMSPTKRFETFYALRQWCDCCAYDDFQEAVKALDEKVLPTLVIDVPEIDQ